MKPKERKTQGQTSRMYLRHHDHREALFDAGYGLMYHYMMYVKKSPRLDDKGHIKEPAIDDYVWHKSPHDYILLHGSMAGGTVDYMAYGWMDIDREFQTITPCNIATNTPTWVPFKNKTGSKDVINTSGGINNLACVDRFIQVGNHILDALGEYRNNTQANVLYTDNGIIWKRITIKNPLGNNLTAVRGRRRPFGNNGWIVGDYFVGTSSYEEGYQHLNAIVILNDETFSGLSISINITGIAGSAYHYCCPTQTGCIIKVTTPTTIYVDTRVEYVYDFRYYHVTTDGNYSLVYTVENAYGQVSYASDARKYENYGIMSYFCHGNLSGFLHFVYVLQYDENSGQERYSWFFIAHITHNNGLTWKAHTLLSSSVLGGFSSMPAAKGHIFFAQGYIYAMVSTSDHSAEYAAYEVKMYRSLTGDVWEEIVLPKWLDIPIITENAGLGINNSVSSEKLRVAINPYLTSDADCNLHDLYGSEIVRFRNGQINMENDLFGVYLTDGLHNAYLNNHYLAENSKSFAWISGGTSIADDYSFADYVKKYDYCVPAGGFEGEEPDPDMDYVWYVWDDTNQAFEVVDRHLSTYSSYTVIIVTELPATGELLTLYGVRTNLNNNPIYDYYVYSIEDGDFVAVTNLTLYANYTLVIVATLPSVGAANIIYGVPVTHEAYTSNMYIWNPDAERYNPETGEIEYGDYEDLNTTQYDMTGKKYRTVNVKTLPTKGYIGIIYISEQKYTPQHVTYEDNTYNYYQFDILNANFYIISPVRNKARFNIIEVLELPTPAEASQDPRGTVYKIPKELDESSFDKHDYFESESKLKEFLENHFDKQIQYVYTRELLPLVGVMGIYYCVKESPGQYSGTYTVYLWDWMMKEYDKHSEYHYYIADDPDDPKEVRLIDVVKDFVIGD